jgi:hypothetical protein
MQNKKPRSRRGFLLIVRVDREKEGKIINIECKLEIANCKI